MLKGSSDPFVEAADVTGRFDDHTFTGTNISQGAEDVFLNVAYPWRWQFPIGV